MDLSFIFPCLNEAETLGQCILEVRSALEQTGLAFEIIVADNGSRDGSADIALELGARVVTETKKGYGAAIAAGIRAARGTYVAFADADGSYPLENLPSLYETARNADADMVIASRFRGTIEKGAMPLSHRYLGTPFLTMLINWIYGGRLSDCNSGFRLIRKSSYESWGIHSSGMEFASELLVRALKNKALIVEIASGLRCDLRSRKPHLKTWRDGMRHLLFILSEAPGLFEKAGLFFAVFATLVQITAFLTGQTSVGNLYICGIHTKIIALILAALGVQMYLLACYLLVVSPEEKCFSLTRYLVNMPADILFFLLCILGVILLAVLTFVVSTWGYNHFAYLDLSSLLFILTHFMILIGFMGFGLLEIHIIKKKIPEKNV